jgi:hypothetical protein
MPGKSYTTGASTNRTTDLKVPKKSDGTKDKRYSMPQFVKSDGSRDMRTTPTSKKR